MKTRKYTPLGYPHLDRMIFFSIFIAREEQMCYKCATCLFVHCSVSQLWLMSFLLCATWNSSRRNFVECEAPASNRSKQIRIYRDSASRKADLGWNVSHLPRRVLPVLRPTSRTMSPLLSSQILPREDAFHFNPRYYGHPLFTDSFDLQRSKTFESRFGNLIPVTFRNPNTSEKKIIKTEHTNWIILSRTDNKSSFCICRVISEWSLFQHNEILMRERPKRSPLYLSCI